MSDSEDDYMSAEILQGVSDQRVGIATSRAHKRQLQINSRFEESREPTRPKKPASHAEREKERRDEALAKPISHESKGFALMAKMGFKPGMTLGKQREDEIRITEPISLEIKANRTGLGHEAEVVQERNDRVEAVMQKMKEQAAKHEELIEDYSNRRRLDEKVKQLVKDIRACRKVCEELDHRIDRTVPRIAWYWRSYKVIKDDEKEVRNYHKKVVDEEEEEYKYSNGQPAPADPNWDVTTPMDELENNLSNINTYLRDNHFYCIWCGANYCSPEDMAEHCPGNTRRAHHGDDDHD
uniref:G patch domain-containing protein 11 n=1 Tax=Caenorhabditis japonica TaxID=281687 RepID=A0A8R1DJ72_CAEJA